MKIEKHYGEPQDIEWAYEDEKLYILQTRPITTNENKAKGELVDKPIVVTGLGASYGVAKGKVRKITDKEELDKVQAGDIVFTHMTTPDYIPIFHKIAGLVTEIGGLTCHAAIVSREYNLPCVVNAGHIFGIEDDLVVTVDGGNGIVYKGNVTKHISAL